MLQLVLSLIVLAATIATLAHIITRDEWQVRHLPKILWIIIVIIVPIIGMVLWWTVGREPSASTEPMPFGDPRRSETIRTTERPLDDDDIEAAVEREIAFHENQARIRRLEAELRAKKQPE